MFELIKVDRIRMAKGDIRKLVSKTLSAPHEEIKEIYISEVEPGHVKGWKLHIQMTCSLHVLHGEITFYVQDDVGQTEVITIRDTDDYCMKILPGTWFAFENNSNDRASILNLADIYHDPLESKTKAFIVEKNGTTFNG